MNEKKPSIELTAVSKTFITSFFRKKEAIKDISFSVSSGEIVGLLGPNGSGKSTTLKIILGFLHPSEGQVRIGDIDAKNLRAREQLGYLPENPRFQKFLTAKDILIYYGNLLRMDRPQLTKRVGDLLDLVGLKHAENERVQGFSKGMTQRLAIAQALLNSPPILIFDEPMSGLDPLGRREIRQLIWAIHEQMPGTTIFFSTHILNDVEELCSSVVLLRQGRLVAQDSVDNLMKPYLNSYEVVADLSDDAYKSLLRDKNLKVKKVPGGFRLQIEGTEALGRKIEELRSQGTKILRVQSQRHGLEKALFGGDDSEANVVGGER